MASLSENTLKQYEVCFKRWFTFCKENNVNMFETSIPIILEFLTNLFHSGAQYGTINSHRSALSLIFGNISDDERIIRFCKGVYKLRPPLPKYNVTWDASIVLNHLATMFPNENLTLEALSKKCITLLALVTAHRVQTLSKIKIDQIVYQNSKIIIKITDFIKTSKAGTKQPILHLPFFNDRPEICPAKTLDIYINKTKSIRKTDHLFIGFRKPYNCVTTQTLSRWIKSTLKDSGIDVSIFSSHSTRHAATSMAHKLGVNLDIIRQTAGWSGNSTAFAQFYNRPVINSDDDLLLARTICSL
ncbi:uncharacterized protein LOC123704481 [Colias croceus]|uniref:uncharacterized protein LOC123704481 n=1 Tax=Colias crocea TaxID=72248 RepID=UPI001E27F4A7|nr:uncharacterized protein LOC123704481 [Colias croceus]